MNKNLFLFVKVLFLLCFLNVLFILLMNFPENLDSITSGEEKFDLGTVSDWILFNGSFYGGIIGAFFATIFAYFIVNYHIRSSELVSSHKPFFIVDKIEQFYKDGYGITLVYKEKLSDLSIDIRDIDVLFPISSKDNKKIEDMGKSIKELVSSIHTKNQKRIIESRNSLTKPQATKGLNETEQGIECDIIGIKSNIEKHMNDDFTTFYFKLQNVGRGVAQYLRFYNYHFDTFHKKIAKAYGKDIDLLSHFKMNDSIFIKFSFVKGRIDKNLRFTLVYRDLLGNLYHQKITLKDFNLPEVIAEQPELIKHSFKIDHDEIERRRVRRTNRNDE